MVEGAVAAHLINRFSTEFSKYVYYWRAVDEVDFVVDYENKILQIEVKYRNKMNAMDLKELLGFMEKFEVGRGIVVSKDVLKKEEIDGKEIDYIPAWVFLGMF